MFNILIRQAPLRLLAKFSRKYPPSSVLSRSLTSKSALLSKVPQCYSVYPQSLLLSSKLIPVHPEVFAQAIRYYSQQSSNRSDKEENEESPQEKNARLIGAFLMALLLLFAYIFHQTQKYHLLTWEVFVKDVLSVGEVKAVDVIENDRVATIELFPGAVSVHQRFNMNIDSRPLAIYLDEGLDEFEKKLHDAEDEMKISAKDRIEVRFKKATTVDKMVTGLYTLTVYVLITAAVFYALMRSRGAGNMQQFMNMDPTKQMTKIRSSLRGSDSAAMRAATGGVTFKDVAGLKAAKEEVAEFVAYLKEPDRFSRLGARLPRGALLLGPPGCGKTLLVKALANEADVPFFYMGGPEFVEVIGGVGASRVRKLFKQASQQAPSIIFIDEIDTIGGKRSGTTVGGMGSSETEQTLNQLLVEMDGMSSSTNIIVFAATNRHEVLDNALLRPGRFDRHVLIDLPTLEEREELFQLYLAKYKVLLNLDVLARRLAAMTPGMSGADIANVCNEAALAAARENHPSVLAADFEEALERVVAGAAKKSSTLTAAERRTIAVHESGHALAGWMQQSTDALMRISVIPRTSAVAGFVQTAPREKKLYNKEELFERMVVLLGGRAAELIVNDGAVTSGAQDDLKKVTELAYSQVRNLGMSDVIGHVSYSEADASDPVQPYSKLTQSLIDEEASRLVAKSFLRAQEIISANKDKLATLTSQLLKKESLSYEDLVELIGIPPHGHKRTVEPLSIMEELNDLKPKD